MTAASPAGPPEAGIARVLGMKYGDPPTGWGPLLRRRFGYRTPDDLYEATVAELVTPGISWADIGCGHELFPSNKPLARLLADRAGLLVGVDPDETLEENPFVHRKVRALLTDYRPEQPFDLVTLRMVAEHIPDAEAAAAALARMVRPGGRVLIYTVNLWAPVSLAAKCVPFGLHHPIKKVLWRTEEKDTFPTYFRMNTRKRLAALMGAHGLRETGFQYLDDCRTLQRFPLTNRIELLTWRALRAVGLHYPETCLLGTYRRD
jgi:2-polyprenyl-3-methyl-5-hydroxy-6-metoxy-1,4-benzoquinol methylase